MAEKKEHIVLMTNVRLSYAYVFKAYEGDDGKKSYGSHMIFTAEQPYEPKVPLPNGEKITLKAALQRAIRECAVEKWGDKAEEVLKTLAAQDRLCLHKGDVSKAGQAAYAGKLYVSSNNAAKPNAYDSKGRAVTDPTHPEAVYSGCIAQVAINIWAQENKYGKRINAEPMGFKFTRHEERLSGGGRVASADEFVDSGEADGEAPTGSDDTDGLI